jgi:hypothetical protein
VTQVIGEIYLRGRLIRGLTIHVMEHEIGIKFQSGQPSNEVEDPQKTIKRWGGRKLLALMSGRERWEYFTHKEQAAARVKVWRNQNRIDGFTKAVDVLDSEAA